MGLTPCCIISGTASCDPVLPFFPSDNTHLSMEDKTTLSESTVVVMADHLTSVQVDGERVLLDLEEGIYYGLNPVGARIWEEIQEPTSVEKITAAITAEYDVGSEKCLEDVISLLQDLEENGLIEIEKE